MSQARTAAGGAALPTTLCGWGKLLPVGLFLLASLGCEDRGAQEARQEAVSARAETERLKFALQKARQEISELNAELTAVRESRDALQKRVAQLIQDRDDALAFAAEAQDAMTSLTSQARGQVTAKAALEHEIAELRALAEDQQALIEELQKGETPAPELGETPTEPLEEETPLEPDEGL